MPVQCRWLHEWMCGWMDGWMNRITYIRFYEWVEVWMNDWENKWSSVVWREIKFMRQCAESRDVKLREYIVHNTTLYYITLHDTTSHYTTLHNSISPCNAQLTGRHSHTVCNARHKNVRYHKLKQCEWRKCRHIVVSNFTKMEQLLDRCVAIREVERSQFIVMCALLTVHAHKLCDKCFLLITPTLHVDRKRCTFRPKYG